MLKQLFIFFKLKDFWLEKQQIYKIIIFVLLFYFIKFIVSFICLYFIYYICLIHCIFLEGEDSCISISVHVKGNLKYTKYFISESVFGNSWISSHILLICIVFIPEITWTSFIIVIYSHFMISQLITAKNISKYFLQLKHHIYTFNHLFEYTSSV